jgi:hypothetical protein
VDFSEILSSIESEIDRLQQVRDLLTGISSPSAKTVPKSKRIRATAAPAQKATSKVPGATAKNSITEKTSLPEREINVSIVEVSPRRWARRTPAKTDDGGYGIAKPSEPKRSVKRDFFRGGPQKRRKGGTDDGGYGIAKQRAR